MAAKVVAWAADMADPSMAVAWVADTAEVLRQGTVSCGRDINCRRIGVFWIEEMTDEMTPFWIDEMMSFQVVLVVLSCTSLYFLSRARARVKI